jgi:hypothetical protein
LLFCGNNGYVNEPVCYFVCTFSLLFFTHPLLSLRFLSSHSTITNLHIFLCRSYSFLSMTGWRLSYSCRCFSRRERVKIFVRVVINVFLCLWKTWIFVVSNRISQDTGTELFRAHKTRTVPKPGMIWVHIFNIGTYVGEVTGVPQLVEALCYKPEGRRIYGLGVDSASNRNEYQVAPWRVKVADV